MDLTKLHRFVRRPEHQVRNPREAVAEIDGLAEWFTALDAIDGNFPIALKPSCQHLATFAAPKNVTDLRSFLELAEEFAGF